jgi:NADPH2:quinone reductase
VEGLNAYLANGELKHLLAPAYALDDVAAAHLAVESGRTPGRVIVRLPE